MRITGPIARVLSLLPLAAAGCGLLAPSDAELMGGDTPSGSSTESDAAAPERSDTGSAPAPAVDAGTTGDDPTTPPECTAICSVVPPTCRAAPSCRCLFSGASCGQTSCSSNNDAITGTCGPTVCTGGGDGPVTCLKDGVSCPCK